MKRTVLIALCSAGIALLVFGLIHYLPAQTAAPQGPTEMDNSFGKVTFQHSTHSTVGDCKTCHHIGTTDKKCTECHNEAAATNAQKAFHKNCTGCHSKESKGPTACTDCHKK